MLDPTSYPDAPRFIPATPELLHDWEYGGRLTRCNACGSTDVRTICTFCGDSTYDHKCNEGCRTCECEHYSLWLDPLRSEVRDHLIRHLLFPTWLRDGDHLKPWVSAGLIACAVALKGNDRHLRSPLAPWVSQGKDPDTAWTRNQTIIRTWPAIGLFVWEEEKDENLCGWAVEQDREGEMPGLQSFGPEVGQTGRNCADRYALDHLIPLLQDDDTLVLPWPEPDGTIVPRVWRRDPGGPRA